MIKVLHAADFHLDSPHSGLSAGCAATRRAEQRTLLKHLFALAKEKEVDLILLPGDLLDSDNAYFETTELLLELFAQCSARIFIAPGNHDYYGLGSPYKALIFPDNVHIFTGKQITSVEIEELGVRVYGAAFVSPEEGPALQDFVAEKDDYINIMVLHAPMSGNRYNPITPKDISASKLHYLALGHTHTCTGVLKSGRTFYAYSGCPEGRGFDETGEKGVLIGEIGKSKADLEFVPMHGRRYEIYEIELNDDSDHIEQIREALPPGGSGNIVRIILKGEVEKPDMRALEAALTDEFFSLEIRDETTLPYSLWAGMGELTLRGLALEALKDAYDSNDGDRDIAQAARWLLHALDNREVPKL